MDSYSNAFYYKGTKNQPTHNSLCQKKTKLNAQYILQHNTRQYVHKKQAQKNHLRSREIIPSVGIFPKKSKTRQTKKKENIKRMNLHKLHPLPNGHPTKTHRPIGALLIPIQYIPKGIILKFPLLIRSLKDIVVVASLVVTAIIPLKIRKCGTLALDYVIANCMVRVGRGVCSRRSERRSNLLLETVNQCFQLPTSILLYHD